MGNTLLLDDELATTRRVVVPIGESSDIPDYKNTVGNYASNGKHHEGHYRKANIGRPVHNVDNGTRIPVTGDHTKYTVVVVDYNGRVPG